MDCQDIYKHYQYNSGGGVQKRDMGTWALDEALQSPIKFCPLLQQHGSKKYVYRESPIRYIQFRVFSRIEKKKKKNK